MADPSGVFGGLTGAAVAALKSKKKPISEQEDEALKKASPDFDGSNLMKPDGSFSPDSFLHPDRRGGGSSY